MSTTPALLVGGVSSGCGKTTATLGLMVALARRGLTVQGFKVGPDYIDPGLHGLVTGRPSWNLDGWMGDRASLVRAFGRVMSGDVWSAGGLQAGPDIGIVEGVMGLFDGADGASDRGSSAEVAAWLDIPVVLVVDVRGLSRSVAAIARGYASMREDLRFGGVIATRVASPNHANLLREAMRSTCPDIPLLACLPLDDTLTRPSRHLGLITAEDGPLPPQQQDALAAWFADNADMDALIRLARNGGVPRPVEETPAVPRRARIAIARDEAFCFVYPAFLDALDRAGAEIVFFSPMRDVAVPACDGVWLPGGYPELYATRLSENRAMAQSLREAALRVPVHGECGGYIWLLESLEVEGQRYPMSGCLPGAARLGVRRAALGYRSLSLCEDHPLGLAGTLLRGHEFHYSALIGEVQQLYAGDVRPLWTVADRQGRPLSFEGLRRGMISGTWIHLHPDCDAAMVARFVRACVRT